MSEESLKIETITNEFFIILGKLYFDYNNNTEPALNIHDEVDNILLLSWYLTGAKATI